MTFDELVKGKETTPSIFEIGSGPAHGFILAHYFYDKKNDKLELKCANEEYITAGRDFDFSEWVILKYHDIDKTSELYKKTEENVKKWKENRFNYKARAANN